MNTKIAASVIITIILMGLACFIPAGTVLFTGGWQLIAMALGAAAIAFAFMKKRSPKLLYKRAKLGSRDAKQAGFSAFAAVLLILVPVLCGFDYRLKLTFVTVTARLVFLVIFILGFLLYLWVFSVNRYLYSDIRTENDQELVDKGPYRFIRHPMYMATAIMYVSLPLSAGSLLGLLGALLLPVLFAKRIAYEEKILDAQLEGYAEYRNRVKYRMLPFIW